MEVRPTASLDEFRRALVIWQYFGNEATDEDAERFSKWLPLERMHAAWDGDEVAGGAGAFPFETTVPGGRVRAAGVTVVGVHPTHRRRGVLRELMRAQLDDIHERGEPIAYLWPSESTIYGRFGYGLASWQLDLDVPRDRSGFAAPVDPYGCVRRVTREEALAAFPVVYDAVLDERPGMFARSGEWWQSRVLSEKPRVPGPQHQRVLLEADGRPQAYAIYSVHQEWAAGSSAGHVRVIEAMGRTPEATRAIWRFLLDLDWTTSIRADKLPTDHPFLLLLAEPRRAKARLGDALWVRLVDVGAALSARSYTGDGSIVFDVRDAFCPWNEGRWRVSAAGVARTDAEPELALDVAELGAVYLGGIAFAQLREALRVRELAPGAVGRADELFRTDRAPWCPEIF